MGMVLRENWNVGIVFTGMLEHWNVGIMGENGFL
jgi:hypothetical protein